MTKWVMKIAGNAAGLPCPEAGRYIQSVDIEAAGGIGHLVATSDVKEAMTFDSPTAALEFYKRSPKCRPTRWDGHPNRPLTAYNMEFLQIC